MYPSKAEGRSSLSVHIAVPIFTSRDTHDTILRLREVSGIPQMQYFGMFITLYYGPARLDHPLYSVYCFVVAQVSTVGRSEGRCS